MEACTWKETQKEFMTKNEEEMACFSQLEKPPKKHEDKLKIDWVFGNLKNNFLKISHLNFLKVSHLNFFFIWVTLRNPPYFTKNKQKIIY